MVKAKVRPQSAANDIKMCIKLRIVLNISREGLNILYQIFPKICCKMY